MPDQAAAILNDTRAKLAAVRQLFDCPDSDGRELGCGECRGIDLILSGIDYDLERVSDLLPTGIRGDVAQIATVD